MKHFFTFALFMLLACLKLVAQNIQLSGSVTSSDDGSTLPGVTIRVEGTTIGTITDVNGSYQVTVPATAKTLIFSFVGYETETVKIGKEPIINLYLNPVAQQLNEVVVTALGIKRSEKSIGYSIQEVKARELEVTRDASVINQLAGKVAGLTISSTNSGAGSSSRILLRGVRSFTSNNQALIVVDGVPVENTTLSNAENTWGGKDNGNGVADINPDDIESVSILKGASASALYGSRAANGVIQINTKKGGEKKKIGVSYTNNTSVDQAYVLWDLQNIYGAGRDGQLVPPFKMINGIPVYDVQSSSAFGSWGPEMKGQEITDWDGQKRQYLPQPGNYKDYFRNGWTVNNSLGVDWGTNNFSVRGSVADLRIREIVPNSSFSRTNIGLNLYGRLLKNLEFQTYLAYVRQKADNRYGLSDSHDNVSRNYIMMPRNISDESMKNRITNAAGEEQTWYMNWAWMSNPYYNPDNLLNGDTKNRYFGNGSLTYKPVEGLSLMIRTAPDYSTIKSFSYANKGSLSNSLGGYSEGNIKQFLINTDFLISYENQIVKDLTYRVNLGGNAMMQRFDYESGNTVSGIREPFWFSLENSVDKPYHRTSYVEKAVNSLYAFGELDFKHLLFLELTGRNDWSSTLPKGNNSYFYPSVSLGFVFSDLLKMSKEAENIFSYGKIRASYAEVGNDAAPYQLQVTYFIDSLTSNYGTYSYITGTVPPLNLKPEKTKSVELGTNLRFFMNRLAFDMTWYRTNTINQIVPVDVSTASGSSKALINAGKIRNTGIEITATVNPVNGKNFKWNFILNYARNRSMVVELAPGVDNLQILEHWRLSIEARPGHPYGDIVGTAIRRDQYGNKLVDGHGMYLRDSVPQVLGNINPDYTLSLLNNFAWKNLSLSFLIDARIGGELFAGTNMYGYGYSGNFTETLEGRADWYASETARQIADQTPEEWSATGGYMASGVYAPGSVIKGVDVSGKPNSTFVNPEKYWDQFSSWTNEIHEPFVYDASFVKLRELTLTYNLPQKWISKIKMKRASLSVYGKNLWIIWKAVPNIDPESFFTNGNGQGYELYSYPNKRSYGVSLTINI
ncbi:MAG: SusC/RagA family TonB-linked outer membrane protein [Bacteroidota bacterium]